MHSVENVDCLMEAEDQFLAENLQLELGVPGRTDRTVCIKQKEAREKAITNARGRLRLVNGEPV